MGKNSPAHAKWTSTQYGRGASRSARVALRTIEQLDMSRDEILLFLKLLSKTMQKQLNERNGRFSLKYPFIDKAINEVLLSMSQKVSSESER